MLEPTYSQSGFLLWLLSMRCLEFDDQGMDTLMDAGATR